MSTTSIPLPSEGAPQGEAVAHVHEHDPHQRHHFKTMEQQFDTSKIGMWLFLATEILLFGGLFVGFGMMQNRYPREFVEAHTHLTRWQGALNTMVLLFSSWTMVLGVQAAKKGDNKKLMKFLAITMVCGLIFLTIKYFEYAHKWHEGWLPGIFYSATGDSIPGSHGYSTFFAFYFMMTGLHGIHIIVGIGVMLWLFRRAWRNEFSASYYTPVELSGLYWHLVDIIWIYLFPLFYLIK